MAPETIRADATLNDAEKQQNHNHEVREMISALTGRLRSIQRTQKPGSSSTTLNPDDDGQGVRIITLAGSNMGAAMQGEIDEKLADPQGMALPEQEDSATFVNSNFQAINNSIMFGGSCEANDPGVHLDISDYDEKNDHPKRGKKGRKSRRRGHRSDYHSGRSDKTGDDETN